MAIFRSYKIYDVKNIRIHQVGLFFSEQPNDSVTYAYGSCIESLFPNSPIESARKILDNKIGENIDINLYSITVQEMTDGVYKQFVCKNPFSSEIVKEMRAASIMTKEEEIQSRKIAFTFPSFDGNIIGIRQDNNVKEVINDPGLTFDLTTFLNYHLSTKTLWDCSKWYGSGNPDKIIITKAIVEYKTKVNSKYKSKLEHLFD